jgi:putative addiction module antidote
MYSSRFADDRIRSSRVATTTKVIAVGDSLGVILPQEMLARLKLEVGDTVYIRETPSGLQLSPCDEEFAAKMEAADSIVRRYGDALKKLAE